METTAPPLPDAKAIVVGFALPGCERMGAEETTANVKSSIGATGQNALIDLSRSFGECVAPPATRRVRRASKDHFQVTMAFKDSVTEEQVQAAVEATNVAITVGMTVTLTVGGTTVTVTVPKDMVVKRAVVRGSAENRETLVCSDTRTPCVFISSNSTTAAPNATTAEPPFKLPKAAACLAHSSTLLLAAAAWSCAMLV